jgi:hypothetical protein
MPSRDSDYDYQIMLSQCGSANGMLPAEVYCKIFDSIKSLSGEPILEIGTAHGAATISLGLGAKRYDTKHKIVTADLFGGRFSSRRAYGDTDQNFKIVIDNLARAGISEDVHVFKGSSEELAKSEYCPQSISMLMLDADGRIDRDFLLFYPKVKEGGIIVIDDADPGIYLSLNFDGEAYVDLKHRITSLLAKAFHQAGFISDLEMVSNTLFCRSTAKQLDVEEFKTMALKAYRELVFSEVGGNWVDLFHLQSCPGRARKALNYYNRASKMLSLFSRLRNMIG